CEVFAQVVRRKLYSMVVFFFSSRRRHTRWPRDWSSDVCSSDLGRSSSNVGRSASAMPDGQIISFTNGVARVLSRADLKDIDAWQLAFAGKTKDHRFYEIVADTLDSKFEHHYLLLEDRAGKVRAIQPV